VPLPASDHVRRLARDVGGPALSAGVRDTSSASSDSHESDEIISIANQIGSSTTISWQSARRNHDWNQVLLKLCKVRSADA
jgi:hypothetical protein